MGTKLCKLGEDKKRAIIVETNEYDRKKKFFIKSSHRGALKKCENVLTKVTLP